MAGSFIISLDCEGNWGFADRIERVESGFTTKSALMKSYATLLHHLRIFEMPATFAFVMAFILKEDELDEWLPRLTDVQVDGLNWMRNFRRAETRRNFSGWFCAEALELVRDCGAHEIACHGFRHAPLGDKGLEDAEAAYEIQSAAEVAEMKGIALKTFVFPRNHVGHLSKLARQGYIGFRNAHPRQGRHGRFGNLIQEINLQERAQCAEPNRYDMVSIPGGYFLNWRHGLRRAVPEFVTLLRWRSILEDAAAKGWTALLFLHPHNLIDGHGMAELFEGVLRIAAELRDSMGLKVLTQQEYCEQVRNNFR